MEIKDRLIWSFLGALAGFLIAHFVGVGRFAEGAAIETRVDTVHDTIRDVRPPAVAERILGKRTENAFFHTRNLEKNIPDTVLRIVHDTIKDEYTVDVPITQRVYRMYGSYTAWVSGYRPCLDSIAVYDRIITKTSVLREKYKRFAVGVHAGYGVGRDGLSPYVGIGVSYRLFGF